MERLFDVIEGLVRERTSLRAEHRYAEADAVRERIASIRVGGPIRYGVKLLDPGDWYWSVIGSA